MKKIKDIFLFSYIKNKGIRRTCFIIGICLCIMPLYNIQQSIFNRNVDKLYSNLKSANEDLYYSSKYNNPYWYRKMECMSIYLKKYNIEKIQAYSFTTYENVISTHSWCDLYKKECSILKSIKNDPIHLKCSGIETYEHTTTEALFISFLFLSIVFYIPFIFVATLKIIFRILKWVISGFKEGKKTI